MGTTVSSGGVSEATSVELPWDVPVELVSAPWSGRASGSAPASTVRKVDLGVELPGVEGVVVETVLVGGRTLLSGIRPLAARSATDPVPLRGVLKELLDEGRVPVLSVGTPFTQSVLAALVGVGVGSRCTYAALAAAAGRPRAVRAAAHVMATNRVPLVLPCHRVVPAGGGTGRYGWGDAAKVALLDLEQHGASGALRVSG